VLYLVNYFRGLVGENLSVKPKRQEENRSPTWEKKAGTTLSEMGWGSTRIRERDVRTERKLDTQMETFNSTQPPPPPHGSCGFRLKSTFHGGSKGISTESVGTLVRIERLCLCSQ